MFVFNDLIIPIIKIYFNLTPIKRQNYNKFYLLLLPAYIVY